MAEDEQASVAPVAHAFRLDARIERWFAEHFHGSPHMRDTETFNHVRRAVDDLKRQLGEIDQ